MPHPREPEIPGNHVVHVLPELSPDAAPPERLGFPPPLGAGVRAAAGAALLVFTAVAVWSLVALWTARDTPGLWFQLLFTAIEAGLLVAAWAFAAATRATGRERAAAVAAWAEVRMRASPAAARIVDRQVSLAEDGSVSRFEVTVELGDGGRMGAGWTPHPHRSAVLLQPQLPGIGAAARVWSVPDHPDAPVVVEVVDPTRVNGAAHSGA